jgi:hypothetical protein
VAEFQTPQFPRTDNADKGNPFRMYQTSIPAFAAAYA